MTYTKEEIGSTWLETEGWQVHKGAGTCSVTISGRIAEKAASYFNMKDGEQSYAYAIIDPARRIVTEIQHVVFGKKGTCMDMAVRIVSPEEQKVLYERLSYCAASYTADPENFFEAFVETSLNEIKAKEVAA